MINGIFQNLCQGIFNNIYGMLVVRESVRKEVHQKLMDTDLSSHSIMLRTAKKSHQSMILINGHHPSAEVIVNVYVNLPLI